MRINPPSIGCIGLLLLSLIYTGYPLAHHAAGAQRTRRPGATATPTPTPTRTRRATNTNQNPDQTPTPTPTPTPRPGHGGRDAAIIGGVAGAAVIGALILTHGDSAANKLSKNGPQFPKQYDMSNLKVQGFVRGDWPVVVAYELAQPAVVTLTITAEKVDPFVQQLEGAPGAHEIVIRHLPTRFADKPRAAIYALTAMSDDPNAPSQPVPLQLLGLGAGYNAVGSVGIDQVNFAPGRVNASQSQQADYSFHSLFDFYKVNVEFMQITRGPKREIIATRVDGVDYKRGITQGGQLGGQWNCRKDRRVSQGLHQLQVRGWRSLDKGGDWVAAVSHQSVLID